MAKEKNALVFTTWSYKEGLIQSVTLPYIKIIAEITKGKVYLICLEQENLRMTQEEVGAAKEKWARHNIHLILFRYRKNKLGAALDWGFRLIYLILLLYTEKISYLHPICTPAGTLALVVSKFKKTNFIMDSFEPHAELMAELGVWNRKSRLFNFVFSMEHRLVKRADKLLAVSKNIGIYIKENLRIVPPVDKMYYRPLCVEPELFVRTTPDYSLIGHVQRPAGNIGVYTGKIGAMYYDTELCHFIKECIRFWEGDFFLVMCTPMPKEEITRYFTENGIAEKHFSVLFVTHREIPLYLSLADFGISFSRPVQARRFGCPTKNAEYWSSGLPIIATDAIMDDTLDIGNNPYLGVILNKAPEGDLTLELRKLSTLIKNGEHARIRAFAVKERSMESVRATYAQVYEEEMVNPDVE